MVRHSIRSAQMITGNPRFKWILEHMFNTLTFEMNFRLHTTINHNSIIVQRYKLNKSGNSIDELHYITDDIDYVSLFVSGIIDDVKNNKPAFIGSMFYFPEIETYISSDNMRLLLDNWSFETKPFKDIQHKQPIHRKMLNCWKIIRSYVQMHYGNNPVLCGFLFHSLVVSSLCHAVVFTHLYATRHTGMIDEPNVYAKPSLNNVLFQYSEPTENITKYLLPDKLIHLCNAIKCELSDISVGFSHTKPFYMRRKI